MHTIYVSVAKWSVCEDSPESYTILKKYKFAVSRFFTQDFVNANHCIVITFRPFCLQNPYKDSHDIVAGCLYAESPRNVVNPRSLE